MENYWKYILVPGELSYPVPQEPNYSVLPKGKAKFAEYCVSKFYCVLNNNTFKLFINRAHVIQVFLTISFVSHL